MFLVVLILLSVAAYFLLHAFRDWQEEQHSALEYQRAGVKGDSGKSGTTSTGTPASGYKSSQTGKQTTQFRNSTNSSQKQSSSGGSQNGATSVSGVATSNTNRSDSAADKSAGNDNNRTGQKSGSASATSSKTGSGGTASSGSTSTNDVSAGTASGGASSGGTSSGGGRSGNTGSAGSSSGGGRSGNTGSAGASSGGGKSGNTGSAGASSGSSRSGNTGSGAASSGGGRSGNTGLGAANSGAGRSGNKGSGGGNSGSNAASTHGNKPVSKETLRFTNREAHADDLKKINGIGPAIEKDMNAMGVYNFKQIANFQQADIDNVNTALDFPGRIERDEWIPQAKRLMQDQSGSSRSGSAGNQTSGASSRTSGATKPAVTKDTLRFTNREAQADDLQKINGIGPAIEEDMNTMGVYNFKQIANFQQADIDNVNAALDFPGRIERDEWIPQAKRLMQDQSGSGGSGSASKQASAGSTGSGQAAVTKETLRFTNREAQADNLQLISGIGPVIEQDLNSMGIYNFSQIANFQQTDVDNVNTAMDFPGRIERDEWIPQARKLQSSNGSKGSASTSGISSSNSGNSGKSSSGRGSSSWSSGSVAAAAGGAVVAGAAGAALSGSSGKSSDQGATIANSASNSPDDLAGEIRERIKILNLRQSDSRRLAVSNSEFDELARGGHANLGSEKLLEVTKILRWLCDEQV